MSYFLISRTQGLFPLSKFFERNGNPRLNEAIRSWEQDENFILPVPTLSTVSRGRCVRLSHVKGCLQLATGSSFFGYSHDAKGLHHRHSTDSNN